MPDYRGHAAELVHHDHGKNLASDDVVGRLLAEGFDGFRKKPKNCRAPVTILELLLAMRTNVRGGSSLFKKGLMELYEAGERDVANKAASVFISKSSGRSKRILQARLQSLQDHSIGDGFEKVSGDGSQEEEDIDYISDITDASDVGHIHVIHKDGERGGYCNHRSECIFFGSDDEDDVDGFIVTACKGPQ